MAETRNQPRNELQKLDHGSSAFPCLNSTVPKIALAPSPTCIVGRSGVLEMFVTRPNTEEKRIVAVGLLTQGDLDNLGSGFKRAIPLDTEDIFRDLLDAIDKAERMAVPR